MEFPNIPEELYSHFIRGYFDGDGSINKETGGFSIISTKQFIKKVNDILVTTLHINNGIIRESSCHNGITYDLFFHKKIDSSKIFHWLYNDANMHLERKFKIYQQIHCLDNINNFKIA